MDYRADHAVGNSFCVHPLLSLPTYIFHHKFPQAFKGHTLADPFDCPGQVDLTANINFAYLAEALKGTGTFHSSFFQRNMSQLVFIDYSDSARPAVAVYLPPTTWGLRTRVSTLQHAAASPECVDTLGKAATWLIEPTGMGKEYKVMGVTGGVDAEGVWPFIAG
jgi:NADH dehydrogenase [ubiquinone] 1 alpha subcomplex assembly factor 7